MNKLTATKRSKAERLETIRANGMVPAVVYGARVENTMLSVSSTDFGKILKKAGESSTIVLEVKGDSEKGGVSQNIDVLIHDIQVDPVKGFTVHVDFLAIDMNKPVEVTIPVEFIGVAPAEKNSLGVLVKVIHEIDIEALPKDLPHNVTVDVSVLVALDDQIHIKDIVLPKGVKMITDENEVIALIAAIKEEVEESAPVDLASIEVEKKGKKDEEVEATEEKAK
ncbi:MAG: 50S ribosomal protein L25 [Candidatus Pacebacteria bacterium]|nr:50S ribosomal protein L25 [Candidatus Paceibacterota bacterium]